MYKLTLLKTELPIQNNCITKTCFTQVLIISLFYISKNKIFHSYSINL